MMKLKEIDWRIKWHKKGDFNYLHLNLVDSSLEEKIAAFYRIADFSYEINIEVTEPHLLICYDMTEESKRLLNHLIQYLLNQQTFKKIGFYGNRSELIISIVKIVNNQGRNEVKMFETNKEALAYFSK